MADMARRHERSKNGPIIEPTFRSVNRKLNQTQEGVSPDFGVGIGIANGRSQSAKGSAFLISNLPLAAPLDFGAKAELQIAESQRKRGSLLSPSSAICNPAMCNH